jgi:glycolate oxidase FAD binding subunit
MDLIETVASASVVVPVGARTQWSVGGPAPTGDVVEVRAPAGIVQYEPADLTITIGAGLSFAELDAALAEHGQECPLDPSDPQATVGGIIACGLSGMRRARYGPLRDHVLEVHVITGDGRAIKGGGPTVKNVTGYDIPRLYVGSLGTLGVITQVTLRCRPRPAAAEWFVIDRDVELVRPSARVWDGNEVRALVEGRAVDVATQRNGYSSCAAPARLIGGHVGRISVAPAAIDHVAAELPAGQWQAELGVGTIRVAVDAAEQLVTARALAHEHGGWLLREAGGRSDDDGFGVPLPNREVARRIKDAFDPDGKCNPGRLPL